MLQQPELLRTVHKYHLFRDIASLNEWLLSEDHLYTKSIIIYSLISFLAGPSKNTLEVFGNNDSTQIINLLFILRCVLLLIIFYIAMIRDVQNIVNSNHWMLLCSFGECLKPAIC